ETALGRVQSYSDKIGSARVGYQWAEDGDAIDAVTTWRILWMTIVEDRIKEKLYGEYHPRRRVLSYCVDASARTPRGLPEQRPPWPRIWPHSQIWSPSWAR